MSCAELWKPSPSWQKIDLLYTVYCKWQHVERAITEVTRNSVTSHAASSAGLRRSWTSRVLYLSKGIWAHCVDQLVKVHLLRLRSAALGLRQTGLKWDCLANWSAILFAHVVQDLLGWVRCRSSLHSLERGTSESNCCFSVRGWILQIPVLLALDCLLCLRGERII